MYRTLALSVHTHSRRSPPKTLDIDQGILGAARIADKYKMVTFRFADRQGSGLGAAARERGEAGGGHNRPCEERVRGAGRDGDATRLLQEIHDHEQLRPSPPRRRSRGATISSSGEALLVIPKKWSDLARIKLESSSILSALPDTLPFFFFLTNISINIYIYI